MDIENLVENLNLLHGEKQMGNAKLNGRLYLKPGSIDFDEDKNMIRPIMLCERKYGKY